MNVIYKKKVYELICPKILQFPKNCIRNILIERNNKRIITKYKNIKPIKEQFKKLTRFI